MQNQCNSSSVALWFVLHSQLATYNYSTMANPVTSTQKYKEIDGLDALAKALIYKYPDIAWKGTFRTLAG